MPSLASSVNQASTSGKRESSTRFPSYFRQRVDLSLFVTTVLPPHPAHLDTNLFQPQAPGLSDSSVFVDELGTLLSPLVMNTPMLASTKPLGQHHTEPTLSSIAKTPSPTRHLSYHWY